MKQVAVIGSGFAGLSTACFLAKQGFHVTILEKNGSAGGRARSFCENGFTFDMGPSWYWMPDVFENFFRSFGKTPADFYDLRRLSPSYRIIYDKDDYIDVPSDLTELKEMFEALQPGSREKLDQFLKEGKIKYDLAMRELVYKPGLSLAELADTRILKGMLNMHLFNSISSYIRKYFYHPRLIQLLEFPVLFLGATPQNTPALYSLMNYADMALGTWYPMGGMHKIVDGMVSVAKSLSVEFRFNAVVSGIKMNGVKAKGLMINEKLFEFDYIVAGADYHHVEQELLPEANRRYTESYWEKRSMAPSSLIFFLGINKKVEGLQHHTLFFDEDFNKHAEEIYTTPRWPSAPQFYVSCPSKSDPSVAPEGSENLFILIPVAPGLQDTEETREKYFNQVVDRIERKLGVDIRDHIVFKRSYAHRDFVGDYNAYKGNAYGLANTLRQTANLKPSIINKKVLNLFYTGQLTVPGPGVPPSIISGEVVARELIRRHQLN